MRIVDRLLNGLTARLKRRQPMRVLVAGLCIGGSMPLGGCSVAKYGDQQQPMSMTAKPEAESTATTAAPAQHPARVVSTDDRDANIRSAATQELGAEVAASMPQVAPAKPVRPVDAGAAQLMGSIASALPEPARDANGLTVVDVTGVRNLSRVNAREFDAMLGRLATLLTRAGEPSQFVFIADDTSAAQYRMLGTAYMVTDAGFDQWEMFLSMTPTNRDFAVWDARQPVRMLRIARPGAAEITLSR